MQLKEQLSKRSGWTVTAVATGAAAIVGATGLAMAGGNDDRNGLRDGIELRDQSQFETAADTTVTPTPRIAEVPGTIVTLDSDSLDSPSASAAPVVSSIDSSASFESPSPAPVVDSSVSWDSPDSAASISSADSPS